MIKFLKNTFALTDQGVRGTFKSSVLSFLVFVINMVPSMLLLLLVDHPVSYTHLRAHET